jgi:hypothetical protein
MKNSNSPGCEKVSTLRMALEAGTLEWLAPPDAGDKVNTGCLQILCLAMIQFFLVELAEHYPQE